LILKADSLKAGQRQEYLKTAIRHCDRLGKLVEDLFELAKLDSDDVRIIREPFPLTELVQDVVQKFQLQARGKDIDLAAATQGNSPFVVADIGLIERVLENLIENAIHYTPAGGKVDLQVTSRGSEVRVKIKDTGQGIPQERQSQIFDRFYRVDASRSSPAGHSGLGLAITKRILELHNRTIEVASSLNQGTAFSFSLPVHSAKVMKM
jgi:signal transduction histidine kinase